MRRIVLVGLLAFLVSSTAAQSRSVVLRAPAAPPPVSSVPLPDAEEPAGFWTVLGASTLGGVIGGGLGALVGTVNLDDVDRESGTTFSTDEGEVPLFPFGVWLGTTIGAMAGTDAETGGPVPYLSGAGSVLGSLFGLLGGAALGGDRPGGIPIGFTVGATVGAALPAWGHQARSDHEPASSTRTWRVGVRPVRPVQDSGVVPALVVRARW